MGVIHTTPLIRFDLFFLIYFSQHFTRWAVVLSTASINDIALLFTNAAEGCRCCALRSGSRRSPPPPIPPRTFAVRSVTITLLTSLSSSSLERRPISISLTVELAAALVVDAVTVHDDVAVAVVAEDDAEAQQHA